MRIEESRLLPLGWGEHFRTALAAWTGPGRSAGRVTVEHKGGLIVEAPEGTLLADTSGQLRLEGRRGTADEPAVGDWVVIDPRQEEQTATIHGVLTRTTRLVRKSAGRTIEKQVVAANIDVVLLAMAMGRDLNPRRLERLLALAWESGATPVVVLTKADLVEDHEGVTGPLRPIIADTELFVVSTHTGAGLEGLERTLLPGRTLAIIGSSGVGKTTLLNRWIGSDRGRVGEVSDDGKGRHTTTRRELHVLSTGAIVIDTPGMRELGLAATRDGVTRTFPDVEAHASACRFRDCTHRAEPDCAVRAAIERGILSVERFASYQKLAAEAELVERSGEPRASRPRRRPKRRFNDG